MRVKTTALPRDSFPVHLTAVMALGIVSQITQIVFLRELLMVFHGSELSLGVILAAWLLWVGLGSRIGAAFAGRSRHTMTAVTVIAAIMTALLLLLVFAVRLLRGVFAIDSGAYFSVAEMTISCLAVLALPGLLLGAQFVLLARLWRENDGAKDTSGGEKTYIGEASGNVIGGLLFSFFLVHLFNSFQVLLVAGGLLIAAVGLPAGRNLSGKTISSRATQAVVFALLIAMTVLFFYLDGIDRRAYELQWRFFSPEHRLVETRQSRYGTISAAQRENQYSFFQSGNLVFSSAGPETPTPAMEEQEAVVFAHFAMVQHPNPERVLLIGGGLRGTAREMARHPVTQIDYIELDPVLTKLARPYIHESTIKAIDGPRVNLMHTDGRLFVKQTGNTYDIIIVDVPDPSTALLNRYYTEEFFHEVRSRLNPGGVFVTGTISTDDMRGAAVANRNASIYHTMKRVFPEVLPVGRRFLFFFASEDTASVSAEAAVLKKRYLERDIRTEGFSPGRFDLLLEESRLRRINWIIRNHGRDPGAHLNPPETGPLFPGSIAEQILDEAALPPVTNPFFINTDFRPIGYYHTLRFWDARSRSEQGDSFRWILRVRAWWILPAVAACLMLTFLLKSVPVLKRSRTDERFSVLVVVFTTGFSTMALQVALIFSFQSIYGFVYEMIGLITALFMGGLAAGTLASRKLIKVKSNPGTLAVIQFGIALFAVMVGLALPQAALSPFPGLIVVLIGALTFFSGMLNGADFPLAAACYQSLAGNPEQATGTVYGVELFGACLGALAASVVIAPVLGITAVCLLAGAANFTAFLGLIIVKPGMLFLKPPG